MAATGVHAQSPGARWVPSESVNGTMAQRRVASASGHGNEQSVTLYHVCRVTKGSKHTRLNRAQPSRLPDEAIEQWQALSGLDEAIQL